MTIDQNSDSSSKALPRQSAKAQKSWADTARAVSSAALLAGTRELLIQHGKEEYRLRLTANNKLILTK